MTDAMPLPIRARPRPLTRRGMPHAQIGVRPVPEINDELFRRAYSLPDIENRPTMISVPGARALWLRVDVPLAHPEAIAAGREFAHIHPDGSLHVVLPADRAREAVAAGWAELHPLASHLGNEGMVMLYTPLTLAELDVVSQLICDSYNFVTGRAVALEAEQTDAADRSS